MGSFAAFPLCHEDTRMQLNSKHCGQGSSVTFEGTSRLVVKYGRHFISLVMVEIGHKIFFLVTT